jgi:primase-polymerase (primpol)-like protein
MSARTKKEIEQGDAKPHALAVNPDGVPQALKEPQQWIVWKYVRRQDQKGRWKWTKIPVNPRTGRNASSNKPATWGTFQEALSALQNHPKMFSGIGFMFSPDDSFCGVDLDDCRDMETGTVQEWATKVVARFASYTEVSPSGTGVKVFARGKLSKGRNRRGLIEMYDQGRFFAVTGHSLLGTVANVEERQEELNSLQQSLTREPTEATNKGESGKANGKRSDASLSDLQVIEKGKTAANGVKFSRLWDGDTSGYQSQSEADLALCDLLAFWVGPDPVRIDALFRQSGLFRDKWKREDYGTSTIKKALAGRRQFYSGNGLRSNSCGAPRPEDEIHLTDTGNAKRLVKRHGDDLRHCHPWKKWVVWDGSRWRVDDTADVTRKCKQTIAGLFRWAVRKTEEIAKSLEELS